jgi:acetyl esterase/lipase
MVVVNVNYRPASRAHMGDILHDANDALGWVHRGIADHGGDPARIVLGGDSAGGQIAALLAASGRRPELADHYGITPAVPESAIRGVVQHCSAVDFSVIFERGFIMGLHFVRMLLPTRVANHLLPHAARFLSPIEWLDEGFPPVLVTTSEHDFFDQANLNFIARLRSAAVPVETLVFDKSHRRTRHTWQQDDRIAESHTVYRRVQRFILRVAAVGVHPA